jgi:hypothetical protein
MNFFLYIQYLIFDNNVNATLNFVQAVIQRRNH